MADFCRQCTVELFGPEVADKNDMIGLVTEDQTKLGLAANVLCEGCGPTQVDHTGKCLGGCMVKKHGPPPGEDQGELVPATRR